MTFVFPLCSHSENGAFRDLCSDMFFTFLCFLLVISSFKVAPKRSDDVMSRVSKCWKAVLCLTEEMSVLDELPSGMSAVGHEFNVNGSTIYIKYVALNTNTRKTRLCIGWLTKI